MSVALAAAVAPNGAADARTRREHGCALMGWDKKTTERPTTFMMMTKFAGVLVLKVGPQQLARPLSAVQEQYLVALQVPVTCFTLPAG